MSANKANYYASIFDVDLVVTRYVARWVVPGNKE